jgi:hypothetical protein
MAQSPDSDVELQRLQLRYASARVSDERAVQPAHPKLTHRVRTAS